MDKAQQDIQDLSREIIHWQRYLDRESLILFTAATAACGLPHPVLRLAGTTFAIRLFFQRAFQRLNGRGSYKTRVSEVS